MTVFRGEVFLLLLWISNALAVPFNQTSTNHVPSLQSITCRLYQRSDLFASPGGEIAETEETICEHENLLYAVENFPPHVSDSPSGTLTLELNHLHGSLQSGSLSLTDDSTIKVVNKNLADPETKHELFQGVRSMVAIRVSANNVEPSISIKEIHDHLFGAQSLGTRIQACSLGKLSLEPGHIETDSQAQDNTDVVQGVVDIEVDIDPQEVSTLELQNIVSQAVYAKFGDLKSRVNHIIYVLPSGTNLAAVDSNLWYAFSYRNFYLSVVNDQQIRDIPKMLHELGLNLGLRESGENESYTCLNAAKSWWSGWYEGETLEVNSSKSSNVILSSTVDYEPHQEDANKRSYLLVKLGNYYMEFNKRFEKDAQVSIVKSQVLSEDSTSAGILSVGEKLLLFDLGYTIEVCGHVMESETDSLAVAIYPSEASSVCGMPTLEEVEHSDSDILTPRDANEGTEKSVDSTKKTPISVEGLEESHDVVLCKDKVDEVFDVGGETRKSCKWIAAVASRREEFCVDETIRKSCPETCQISECFPPKTMQAQPSPIEEIKHLDSPIRCRLFKMATIEDPKGHRENFVETCEAEGVGTPGLIYEISGIPESSMREFDIADSSGDFEITIANAEQNKETIVLSNTSKFEIGYRNPDHRSLYSSPDRVNGIKTMVAVRVIANGLGPEPSMEEISDKLFGTDGDVQNVKSRYEKCSFGKLKFIPGSGYDLIDGVLEIAIDADPVGADRMDLQNSVTEALQGRYGVDFGEKFDNVVFVFPHGSRTSEGDKWYAYAYINHYLSVFNDQQILYVSNQVHELGHNMGLTHSGRGTSSYADQSGYMGFGYAIDEAPAMCFNAAKSWWTGWYSDKSLEINTEETKSWIGNLVSFVDYEKTDGPVLLKLEDYYINYNKAKGMNKETQDFANEVAIIKAPSLQGKSISQGGLERGENLVLPDIGYTIEVCSQEKNATGVDFARVAIYITSEDSPCGTSPSLGFSNEDEFSVGSNRSTFIDPYPLKGTAKKNGKVVHCRMVKMVTMVEPHGLESEVEEMCEDEDDDTPGMMYEIDGLPRTVEFDDDGEIPFDMTITAAAIKKSLITLSPTTHVDITHRPERRLQASQLNGVRTLVAIRVIANGKAPEPSTREISDKLFGTHGDRVNIKSRYEECSFGKMRFRAGTGNGFVNGVAEIRINMNPDGANRRDLQNEATRVAQQRFGNLQSRFNNVILVLPCCSVRNGGQKWFAYAFTNHWLSVFNNRQIRFVSNQVHEVGHNFGLTHSGESGNDYGDQTGYMGYAYDIDEGPRMCFNAAKSWWTGWFRDKAIDLGRFGAWAGDLAALADYSRTRNTVLIRIQHYYLVFNKAKGINSETQEHKDRVVVTEAKSLTGKSSIKGTIDTGGKLVLPDIGSSVKVCKKYRKSDGVDVASVLIYPFWNVIDCRTYFNAQIANGEFPSDISTVGGPNANIDTGIEIENTQDSALDGHRRFLRALPRQQRNQINKSK